MSSTDVEGKLHVGIFTPAFSYSSSLSYAATVKAALADLGLQEDECEFLKQDNDKLACVIKNNKFTLQYVEQTYTHNKALLDQLERAVEGLVAFQTKLSEDVEVIRDLREQLNSGNTAWELKYKEEHNLRMVLQGKLDQLKIVVNSDISDNAEPSRPKIPKLQLNVMNGKESNERVPPLMIPDLRNGGVTTPTRDVHMEGPRFSHSSPRENAHSPIPQTITNMNGKRSISSTNMLSHLSLSVDAVPHGNGKHPSGGVCSNEVSPRATLSPRAAPVSPRASLSPRAAHAPSSPRAAHASSSPRAVHSQSPVPGHVQHVKEHFRRHSSNFGGASEEGVVRRHSNDIGGKGGTSPRSKSSSEIPPHYFDLTQPDAHAAPVIHGHNSDSYPRRKNVIVHVKSRSEAQLDFPADTLSQNKPVIMRSILQKAPSLLSFRQIEDNKSSLRKRSNSSSNSHSGRGGSSTSSTGSNNSSDSNTASAPCRLCNCAKFRVANVEWMCSCGHANIKHAVFLKASPAPSPTVSPRKMG